MRKLTYCDAINEALHQEMERDSSVFIYGIGVPDHKRIFGTVNGISEKFGEHRLLDTPLAEESMMGFGTGAAIMGLRPIYVHIRVDFLLLAMNQIANILSTYNYMSGLKVPLVIRAVIGRGWGQGMQHSKSVQSIFAHFPGLKVVMPTTPYDAKGMLISAIRDDNPVIVIEHRWLYWAEGNVPAESYTIPLDEPDIIREGKDLTIVATSWMNVESLRAAEILKQNHNIDVEVIDARVIAPFSQKLVDTMIASVNKTKHCIIADNDWVYCGYSAELASQLYERGVTLNKPIKRIGFEQTPCPTVRKLENVFYPNAVKIVRAVEDMLGLHHMFVDESNLYSHENKFKGPF
jgi:pyruvate dehydrogenase E1 component beta subunit